jgi:branched-chain amino acid aminotransferase
MILWQFQKSKFTCFYTDLFAFFVERNCLTFIYNILERAFVYGDLLFESILFEDGLLKNLELHYDRLINSAKFLKMEMPIGFTFKFFESILKDEIQKLGLEQKSKIRFTLFRNANGFYLPDNNSVSWLIEHFLIDVNQPKKEKVVGIYTETYKAFHPLSNLKSGNALIYVLASIYAKEQNWDDALILNEAGRVCEASSSNFFWVKDEIWFTPPISEGCVEGVKRVEILEKQEAVELECEIEDLENADEIYLSNAIQGLVKVKQLILD